MMLLTATLSPPSWAAMLPQKFSATATCNFPEDAPVADGVVAPQPAVAAPPQRSNATAQPIRNLAIAPPLVRPPTAETITHDQESVLFLHVARRSATML